MTSSNEVLYLNIATILSIFLVMPLSIATPKGSFSAMSSKISLSTVNGFLFFCFIVVIMFENITHLKEINDKFCKLLFTLELKKRLKALKPYRFKRSFLLVHLTLVFWGYQDCNFISLLHFNVSKMHVLQYALFSKKPHHMCEE